MDSSIMASLSACELVIHLQADQGRSCLNCCYCSMAVRHILAHFLFLLAVPVIVLLHALPIKHVNGELLNKSHRPTCACTIKWVAWQWMRALVSTFIMFFNCLLGIMKMSLSVLCHAAKSNWTGNSQTVSFISNCHNQNVFWIVTHTLMSGDPCLRFQISGREGFSEN